MPVLVTVWRVTNTKSIGDITEAVVLAEFLSAGFPVLLPFGDNRRYDMVVEIDRRFLRVQCKTAHRCADGACIRFNARSTNRRTGAGTSYRDEADLFAVYSPYTRQVYVLPVDDVGEVGVWLRLVPVRNNQQLKVRLAEDYTLKAWMTRMSAQI